MGGKSLTPTTTNKLNTVPTLAMRRAAIRQGASAAALAGSAGASAHKTPHIRLSPAFDGKDGVLLAVLAAKPLFPSTVSTCYC